MSNPFDSTVQQHVSVRPLNKGMFQNLPSNGLPDGGFWRIQNYNVEQQGLLRRGGYVDFNQNNGVGEHFIGEKMYDIIYFYQRNGSAEQLVLTDKGLYLMTPDGSNVRMTSKTFEDVAIDSNTASDSGEFSVTITLTQEEGERVHQDDELLINGVYYPVIGSTWGGGVAEIDCYGTVTLNELTAYTATNVEHFFSSKGLGPTYAVIPTVGNNTEDKVVIADQAGRGLYQYTSGVLQKFVIDSTDGIEDTEYLVGAKTLTYFDDRLWMGNTEEIDGEYRQRIRWTDAVNFDRVAPASYVDLPYSEGQLLRLVPLGSLLVAYYADAVYLGRRTNMAGQPYFFERLESGNVGLVNSRAVVRHIDTHFFVAEDNIYALSGSTGFTPIGDAVLDEALYYTKKLEQLLEVQVEHDPVTKSIVFLFPDRVESSYDDITSLTSRIWRFYYKTNAWAYDESSFADANKANPNYLYSALLPSNTYVFGRTWQDWDDLGFDAVWNRDVEPSDPDDPNYPTPAEEAFEDYESWTALANEARLGTTLKIGLLSAPLGKQVIVEEVAEADQDTVGGLEYPIWSLIETGDMDYGMPDYTKSVTRLSVKAMHIYSERESPLVEVGGVFTLNISDAMGYHWKRPMTLRFKDNYNEGYANFRSTGSTFKFKLINSQVIAQYRLSEFIMRLVGRGLQIEN